MCLVPENMTETKANTIQQKFVEYGCSERFELLEIIDRYHVFIRCKGCGYKFARETSFLKKSKTHNIECRSCGTHADGSHTPPCSENKRSMDESIVVEYYNQNNSATQTAKKFGMNLRRVRRIIDEAGVSRDRQIIIKFDDYPDVITGNQWLDEEFECAECKRLFTRHQYMIKMNRKSRLLKPPKFCSLTCSRKSANRGRRAKSKERRKAEKSTVIPLGDLIERDGGICQLCGGKVDLADGYFDTSGHFHVGSHYPTIDHIKPLSKGGEHAWDNVQLAHLACNSEKCDRE